MYFSLTRNWDALVIELQRETASTWLTRGDVTALSLGDSSQPAPFAPDRQEHANTWQKTHQ